MGLLTWLEIAHKIGGGRFFIMAFGLALLVVAVRIFLKNLAVRRLCRHLQKAPTFSPELVDCYVRFQGGIITPDAHCLPYSQQPCAYYQTKLLASWKTKQKKPAKGEDTHEKLLYQNESVKQPVLSLVDARDRRVYVDLESFKNKQLPTQQATLTQKEQPWQFPELANCTAPLLPKYQTLRKVVHWYQRGQTAVVYGRLSTDATGRLHLQPSAADEYPSFLVISDAGHQAAEETQIVKKYLKQRANKRNLLIFTCTVATLMLLPGVFGLLS